MQHPVCSLSKKVILAVTLTLILVSCSGSDDSIPETNISVDDSALAAKSDVILEATQHIVESGYNYIEEPDRMPNSIFGTSCPSFDVSVDGTQVTLIVDFGASCQLLSGPEVSGQIILEYGPRVGGFRTIDYVYQDFYFNSHQISGSIFFTEFKNWGLYSVLAFSFVIDSFILLFCLFDFWSISLNA